MDQNCRPRVVVPYHDSLDQVRLQISCEKFDLSSTVETRPSRATVNVMLYGVVGWLDDHNVSIPNSNEAFMFGDQGFPIHS